MKNRYKQAVDKNRQPESLKMNARLREGWFLVSFMFALFLLLSLATYHTTDPGWSSTGFSHQVLNWGGRVGAWMADVCLTLFGVQAFLFPLLIFLSNYLRLKHKEKPFKRPFERIFSSIGWVLLLLAASGFLDLYLSLPQNVVFESGGILGDVVASGMMLLFNRMGATLLLFTFFLCGMTLVTGLSWLNLFKVLKACAEQAWMDFRASIVVKLKNISFRRPVNPKKTIPHEEPKIQQESRVLPAIVKPLREEETVKPVLLSPPVLTKPKPTRPLETIPQMVGDLPSLTLLNPDANKTDKPFASITFDELSRLVEERLQDFGVSVNVVAVHPGPVITRFELDLAPGIKVSKITGLAKDIARSLSAVSVRIVEVIPGKSVIGLEIPNENRELVTLRGMLESDRYQESHSPLSLVLGKDIAGAPMVVDLAKMPHLLVAGTTGSGKSVSLNAMILSMLYKATPQDLRFIMIDPKMLELSIYDGIPHLLTPVITDMKNAANALKWCVNEMDRRYRLMAALGVRNLASYNEKVQTGIDKGEPILMPGVLVVDEETAKMHLKPLPMIVVVVDELADMMMVVGKKVEELIARIAQKARAAGIHLILATQRPSVDVITGLIKANIPTRIAFQVSSRIDSRTILDQQGAEQLLGHGDMLYLPPGAGVPTRVHGAYVADDEVHRVVAAWRTVSAPQYLEDVTVDEVDGNDGNGDLGANGEKDPLYDEAVQIVIETRRASISAVQRRLRIGYNRAARMMEEMERAGVVSTMDHAGSREVLVGEEV